METLIASPDGHDDGRGPAELTSTIDDATWRRLSIPADTTDLDRACDPAALRPGPAQLENPRWN